MVTFGRVHPRIGRIGLAGIAMTALALVHSQSASAQAAAAASTDPTAA